MVFQMNIEHRIGHGWVGDQGLILEVLSKRRRREAPSRASRRSIGFTFVFYFMQKSCEFLALEIFYTPPRTFALGLELSYYRRFLSHF